MAGETIRADAARGEASIPEKALRSESHVLEQLAGLTAVEGTIDTPNSSLAI